MTENLVKKKLANRIIDSRYLEDKHGSLTPMPSNPFATDDNESEPPLRLIGIAGVARSGKDLTAGDIVIDNSRNLPWLEAQVLAVAKRLETQWGEE